jgi:hypothetical protein
VGFNGEIVLTNQRVLTSHSPTNENAPRGGVFVSGGEGGIAVRITLTGLKPAKRERPPKQAHAYLQAARTETIRADDRIPA